MTDELPTFESKAYLDLIEERDTALRDLASSRAELAAVGATIAPLYTSQERVVLMRDREVALQRAEKAERERDEARAALVAFDGAAREAFLRYAATVTTTEIVGEMARLGAALAASPAELAAQVRAQHRAEALREAADVLGETIGGCVSHEAMEFACATLLSKAKRLRALADKERAK